MVDKETVCAVRIFKFLCGVRVELGHVRIDRLNVIEIGSLFNRSVNGFCVDRGLYFEIGRFAVKVAFYGRSVQLTSALMVRLHQYGSDVGIIIEIVLRQGKAFAVTHNGDRDRFSDLYQSFLHGVICL